jgi:hypothetical protein
MRLPCASAEIYFEDREDNSPRTGVEATARPIFPQPPRSLHRMSTALCAGFQHGGRTGFSLSPLIFDRGTSEKPDRLKPVPLASKKTPRRKSGRLGKFGKHKKSDQPNESISLLIVLFKSLSLRRSASILLIECRTVVWCLPPNWRPISGSDAEVSCFTRYIAT